MSKKHFEAIAAILRTHKGQEARVIAEDLAQYFATQNPRFDTEHFIKACQP